MEKIVYEILKYDTGLTFNIPVFLELFVDEMGVMVGFNGDIQQVDEFCNFSYNQTGSTIELIGTIFIEKFKQYYTANFTVNWGDGNISNLPIHSGNTLSTIIHTYTSNNQYTITIKLDSPWTTQTLSKIVTTPQDISVSNPLGTFSGFTIPYTVLPGSQDYINDYDYTPGHTGYTTFKYIAIGGSKLIEKQLYGDTTYSGVTTGTTSEGLTYYDYSIDGFFYRDYPDGYTMITGTTSGYTKEEVFNNIITRNEHFLGFVDEPTIYSDIFIERGKGNVQEPNLRLGEIDSTGEFELYGNGYFNVQKQ